jgi:CubicO group peptidase (beta-lactamase class C family)
MKPVFNRLYVCSLLCSVICLLISCNNGSGKQKSTTDSTAASIIPGPTPVSPQETERIKTACERWYDSVLKQKGFNGGILVAKNGNIIFERYNGTGHLPGTDSITANTALHIASTSKTFTAMAILKLAQEGKLKIDDDYISVYLS